MVSQSQNTPTFTGWPDHPHTSAPVFDPWRYIVGLDGPKDIAGVSRPATTVSSIATAVETDHLSGVASMLASTGVATNGSSAGTDHLSGIASLLGSVDSTIASIETGTSNESSGTSTQTAPVSSVSGASDENVPVRPVPDADVASVQSAWTGTALAPGWNNAFPHVSPPSSLAGSELEELSPEYQLHRELLDS